jgi:hypothetical protein
MATSGDFLMATDTFLAGIDEHGHAVINGLSETM